jgi:hypothetical protein
MKKIIIFCLLTVIACKADMADVFVMRHLVAQNMDATGTTALQGAVIQNITATGTLQAGETTFGAITLDGSMTVINSTIASITVNNAVIEPSDRTVVLNASSVTGNIVFAGAAGKVFLQNGSTIGGTVTNGTVIVE